MATFCQQNRWQLSEVHPEQKVHHTKIKKKNLLIYSISVTKPIKKTSIENRVKCYSVSYFFRRRW